MARTHGKPSTYSHGCRCDLCRAAWSDYAHNNLRQRAYKRANSQASTWVREHLPDVWEQLLADATDYVKETKR